MHRAERVKILVNDSRYNSSKESRHLKSGVRRTEANDFLNSNIQHKRLSVRSIVILI
jgi:hypothetical protein